MHIKLAEPMHLHYTTALPPCCRDKIDVVHADGPTQLAECHMCALCMAVICHIYKAGNVQVGGVGVFDNLHSLSNILTL